MIAALYSFFTTGLLTVGAPDRTDRAIVLPDVASSRPQRALSYRSDIDGLRAVAVLSVVGYHFFLGRISGGFAGVDIFFVISGYLISSIIYKDLEIGGFSILEFYIRRIRRIYPALLIVLAFVCAVGWTLMLPSAFVQLGKQVVGGSTFVANFVLWWQSGYFSPGAEQKPLLHLWSLGVEEQFYILFPALCLAFYRVRLRWVLPASFLVIAAISMLLNVAYVARYREAVFFLPYARLWELLIGAGLSLCQQRRLQPRWIGHFSAAAKTRIGILGLVLLAIALFGINQYDRFPGWWALLPTTGAAFIIAAGQASWVNRHILSCRPAVFVGLISYPLYLWHWPLLCFARIATNSLGQHDISHTLKAALIFLSFALAYLTYRFLEMPIRQMKGTKARRRSAFWLLAGVSSMGAFGIAVILAAGFPTRLPSTVVALDHDYAADAAKAYREGACLLRPDQLPQAFQKSCLDADNGGEGRPLVVIWGDSHAADLLPGFRALQPESGVRLAQYTATLCAPILGLRVRNRPACFSVNNDVIDRIRALKPATVVLSARWDYLEPGQTPALRGEMLRHTIYVLKASGVQHVVVIGSAPFWSEPVIGLLIDEVRRNPTMPAPERLPRSLLDQHDDTALQAAAEQAGATYVSIFDSLCGETSCSATTGPSWRDVVTYDNAHFTEHGSILVVRHIWPRVIQAG